MLFYYTVKIIIINDGTLKKKTAAREPPSFITSLIRAYLMPIFFLSSFGMASL